MKRLLLLVVALIVAVTCSHRLPIPNPSVTLYAFAVPFTGTLKWNERPASEGVISYTIACDAGTNLATPTQVLPAACSAGVCSKAVTLTSFGAHSCTVFATNVNLSGGATVEGSPLNGPSTPLPFTLNQDPGAVGGFGVK